MEILNWEPKLIQLEHTLAKNDYFTKGPLPGYPDAVIFKLLLEKRSIDLNIQNTLTKSLILSFTIGT